MIESRFGLKVLGFCVEVVGLMAFATASAQATVGANWMVAGANVTGTTSVPLKAAAENETEALLTTLVGVAVKNYAKLRN